MVFDGCECVAAVPVDYDCDGAEEGSDMYGVVSCVSRLVLCCAYGRGCEHFSFAVDEVGEDYWDYEYVACGFVGEYVFEDEC